MHKCTHAPFVHSRIGAFPHFACDHPFAAARTPHHPVRVHRVRPPSRPVTITAETAKLAGSTKNLRVSARSAVNVMAVSKPLVVAVLGSTATGKSALALALAERFGGE